MPRIINLDMHRVRKKNTIKMKIKTHRRK